MNLKEAGWQDVDWIHLAQETERWSAPGSVSFPQAVSAKTQPLISIL
jgi:hypothetical protein